LKEALVNIIKEESSSIETLLKALEDQHEALLKSDPMALESCVAIIDKCNKELAASEMKRRGLTQGRAMSEVIDEIGDEEIDSEYRKIKRLLEEVKLQKDTNELLIKQGLGFTSRILTILNPASKNPKTYNGYGKLKR
jgi:hypothetical protein